MHSGVLKTPIPVPPKPQPHAKCHITQFPLLVTMNGTTPLVAARIDGKPAQFLADSYSIISPAGRAATHRRAGGPARHHTVRKPPRPLV